MITRGLFLGDRREGDLGGGLEGALSSSDSILWVGVILGEDLMEEALVLGIASEEGYGEDGLVLIEAGAEEEGMDGVDARNGGR